MQEFIDVAKRNALRSPLTQKHGAVIVFDGKVICEGYNKQLSDRYSIHAEVDVLLKARKKYMSILPECDLFVVRVTGRKNCLAMSKPCERCAKIIADSRIGKTYYTCSESSSLYS